MKEMDYKGYQRAHPCQIMISGAPSTNHLEMCNCSFQNPKEMIWMGIFHLSFQKIMERKKSRRDAQYLCMIGFIFFSFFLFF